MAVRLANFISAFLQVNIFGRGSQTFINKFLIFDIEPEPNS